MAFDFNAKSFRTLLQSAFADNIDALAANGDDEETPAQLLAAMEQAVDVMERADSDAAVTQGAPVLSPKEISEIGDFVMDLLGLIVTRVETASGHQSRELLRLAVPVALWIARHGGRINQLELAVNSLANYANELKDTRQLAELASVIRRIIDAVSDPIRQDLEQTNPMRPWRVLNLNYGIVSTRSHDPALMEQAFDLLVQHLPHDARQFFREGMQQMDVVGYPPEVRAVVEKYDRMWGSDSTLH